MVKAGDLVRMKGDNVIQQVWHVNRVRSDARGIWIQIVEQKDVWHSARDYEVVSESR